MGRYLGQVSYQNQGHMVLDEQMILKDMAAGIDVHSSFLSVAMKRARRPKVGAPSPEVGGAFGDIKYSSRYFCAKLAVL